MQAVVSRHGEDRDAMCRLGRSLVLVIILLIASTTIDAGSTTACHDHSGPEFNDVASLTVLSTAVFDGRLAQDDGDDDVVKFRVGQVYKGAELFPEGLEQSSSAAAVQIAVRLSSTQCARSLRRRRRRRLLIFLNGSLADSNDDERQSVYWSTAAPVRFSKRSVKTVKQHSCSDCGTYTSFQRWNRSRFS